MHWEEDRVSEAFLIAKGANFTMLPLKLLIGGLVKWVGLKLVENLDIQEAIAMAMEMDVDKWGGSSCGNLKMKISDFQCQIILLFLRPFCWRK